MGIKKINIFKQQSIQNVKHHIKSKFYYNLLSIWFNFLIPNITSVHDLLKDNLEHYFYYCTNTSRKMDTVSHSCHSASRRIGCPVSAQ